MVASIEPDTTLTPLNPGTITITCYIEKDGNGNVYTDVDEYKFSIVQKEGDILNKDEYSGEFTNGVYSKKYNVPENKTENSITYEFECSYNLNGQNLSANLSIT